MKKFLLAISMVASIAATSIGKPEVICTGTKAGGSKVKLMIEDGKKFIQYFDANGNETSERYPTQMQTKEFEVWAGSRGYLAYC